MQSLDPQKNEAFTHLFSCVMEMLDNITEVKDHPDRMYYAWAIVKTIVRKVASISFLLQEIPIPLEGDKRLVSDPISVSVLVRSMLEAYLVWEKIYIVSEKDDEKEFWYFAWALQSLRPRAKMELPLPEEEVPSIDPKSGKVVMMKAKDVQENTKKIVAELTKSLEDNPWFKEVIENEETSPERKKYLKQCVKKGWETKPSRLLQESMPYSRSSQIYAFMAASAHLDHMDVKQTTKAQGHKEIIQHAELSLNVVLSILARLCVHLPEVFPHLLPIAQSLPFKTVTWIAAHELVSSGEASKLGSEDSSEISTKK